MKDTNFKPGEFCRFPNSEIPAMIELLRENGHPVWDDESVIVYDSDIIVCVGDGDILATNYAHGLDASTELSRKQFLHKATRGKSQEDTDAPLSTSAENAPVGFDPEKDYKVSFDNGRSWNSTEWHFVGFDLFGDKVVQHIKDRNFQIATNVEEIKVFAASMLKVGEYMETEEGPDGKRNLLTRVDNADYFIDMNNAQNGQFSLSMYDQRQITGRRVNVELIVSEV
jgi:hypothetical protein